MGFLRDLFGPSKEEVWSKLAAEVAGRYTRGGWRGTDRIQVQVGDWILTLRTEAVGKTVATRLRAPFVNRDGFRFSINRSGPLTSLGKWLGMQDLEVGDLLFDREFVVQSNDPVKLGALLANRRIRELLRAQPYAQFSVQDEEAWPGPRFPDRVDQLFFDIPGSVTNLEQLRGLFDLFTEVLHQLCHLDSAYKDDLDLHVETLLGPGGKIELEGTLIWDGETARCRAARLLAATGDRRAVAAMLKALPGSGPELRHHLIQGLQVLGDSGTAPYLLPYLGASASRKAARTALHHLGAGEPAEVFLEAARGSTERLGQLHREWREPFILGFLALLADGMFVEVRGAARALAEWGVEAALPDLRLTLRRVRRDPETRLAVDAAIGELEKRASLPRPAESPAADLAGLPLVAGPAPVQDSLPVPAVPPDLQA